MTKVNWFKKMVPTISTLILILQFVACSSGHNMADGGSTISNITAGYIHHSGHIPEETLTSFIESKRGKDFGYASVIASNIIKTSKCLFIDRIYLAAFIAAFSNFDNNNLGRLNELHIAHIEGSYSLSPEKEYLQRVYAGCEQPATLHRNLNNTSANIFYTALYIKSRLAKINNPSMITKYENVVLNFFHLGSFGAPNPDNVTKVRNSVKEINDFLTRPATNPPPNNPSGPVDKPKIDITPGKSEPTPAPVEQPLAPPSHDGFSDQLVLCPDKHWKVAYYGQFNVWEAQDVKHISDFPGLFAYECLFNEENSEFLIINEDVKRSVKPLTLQGATFIEDNYTAVFQKNINFPANGYYVFSFSNIDDGIELIVNDKSFLRVWEPSEALVQSPKILLNAGSNRIVIKHLERSYGASFNFSFQQVN
ncbi:MAG: hypothetical protein KBD78_03300 [Oligoflexales bacterium]|nr:hypothetical protein [Oligoflexales bacterium]